jgi:hypothetical protein
VIRKLLGEVDDEGHPILEYARELLLCCRCIFSQEIGLCFCNGGAVTSSSDDIKSKPSRESSEAVGSYTTPLVMPSFFFFCFFEKCRHKFVKEIEYKFPIIPD